MMRSAVDATVFENGGRADVERIDSRHVPDVILRGIVNGIVDCCAGDVVFGSCGGSEVRIWADLHEQQVSPKNLVLSLVNSVYKVLAGEQVPRDSLGQPTDILARCQL